jgi:type VI secretion system protein ImpA
MQIDISTLLNPISQEYPAGRDLEYELVYDEIRRARESDPDYLPLDEWSVSSPRVANWSLVQSLSENALREQTKDLQLACWLVEALTQRSGLDGLATGLTFLRGFINRFWFQCWPTLEADLSVRRSKLLRLDKELSQVLINMPLLNHAETSLLYWRQVLISEAKGAPDSTQSEGAGNFSRESVYKRINSLSVETISHQMSNAVILTSLITHLDTDYLAISQDGEGSILHECAGVLTEISEYLSRLKQRVFPDSERVLTPVIAGDEAEASIPPRQIEQSQHFSDREKAIEQLQMVALYFQQNEPSSPVPYLIERAIRWTSMSITQWLEEMLNDDNSLNEINKVLSGVAQ